MTRRLGLLLVASALTLLGAGVWAQNRPGPPTAPRPRDVGLTVAPDVLSGEKVGVRVMSAVDRNGQVQGTLVVNINGRWVDVILPQESSRK